jgi:hypothetical protein
MAATGIPVYIPAVAANGTVASSFKVNGWVPTSAGAPTATRRTFYTDPELATPAANPATLGASGRVFYVSPLLSYAFTITSADEGTTYDTIHIPAGLDGEASVNPLVVATYAAMTALTTGSGLVDNGVYFTYARSTEEDGGAGFWRYDSASTATADASTILAINGGGAGRFFRLDGPELQSRWVGVANDGATNNTTTLAALNTQLDGLTYQKEVLFPAGVTSAVTWPNFDIRYVNFTAAGDARLRNTGTGDTFQINAGGGVTEDYFYGTRIQGPLGIEGASGSGKGVLLNGIQRSLFQQFHVLGCGTDDEAIRIEHGVCLCTINFAASQFFRHPNPPGWYDSAQPKRGLVITKRSFLDQQS